VEPVNLEWKTIERKWQKRWAQARIFTADPQNGKKKFFITVAYPYPNSPQHIGHGRTYTLTDVYARFKRMQGFNVLFPMGFHYTGTPILAIAKRIASEEKELINDFLSIYKVPPEKIATFTKPLNIADYFHDEIRKGMKEIGYSIDWRREFTTIDPPYSRFIEWQFTKLRSIGLISRGDHPVGWCPSCGSPMGQHDTKGDVEPEIGEITLIKFKYQEGYLPTGTLRPETVFGVTNIWIKPDLEYVQVQINGEIWIVSNECVTKLQLLGHKLSIIGLVPGLDLVGQFAENPITQKKIMILPATFVDPNNATGVVMSVPGHAPYDYIALEELKNDESQLSKFHLDSNMVRAIEPVSIISLEGYSDLPAKDILQQLGITKQTDVDIELATKRIYSLEYHSGEMKIITGEYAGFSVSEARERIEDELEQQGKADTMYELINRPVYCRCGSEVVVKIFKDQWFIDYGNETWKALAHQCVENIRIVPGELRQEFKNVVDWLKEKACARKQGLGTKLPWDPEWIIESLSDSVIYMSYYTIAKHITTHHICAEQLNDSVFDYVFLGIGDSNVISVENNISPSVLREMRLEFQYFYPLDSRNSGRDLVQNHLTYFIFNHVAIFPKPLWPRQVAVNGSVLMEGKKMSKSLGNIIPLRDALRTFGADSLRVAVLATAELLQDADFSPALAKSVKERLERFHAFALQILHMEHEDQEKPMKTIDRWLVNRLYQRIQTITTCMENMRFREAIHNALYMLDQDLQWYLRRYNADNGSKGSPIILKTFVETRLLLLAPFAPHICEELWEELEKPELITISKWPHIDAADIDIQIIEGEELVKTLREDVSHIIQATKITPRKLTFYTASKWKWTVYLKILKQSTKEQIQSGKLMKELMNNPQLRKHGKDVSAFMRKIVEDVKKMPMDLVKRRLVIDEMEENQVLLDAQAFFANEFHAEIDVYSEDASNRYDPKHRAGFALPYRPAIFVE
jgi:leucyl-tRNA synthetase